MKAIVTSLIAIGLLVAGSAMALSGGAPAVALTAPKVIEMPAAAQKNNCAACHAIYRRVVGPAWLDVSKKYQGQTKFTYAGKEYSLLEGLMLKVSKGGAGSWGAMPMPANDAAGAKQADIKDLVTFVIGLDKAETDRLVAKKAEAEKATKK
jgi:cytochrome c551/c552